MRRPAALVRRLRAQLGRALGRARSEEGAPSGLRGVAYWEWRARRYGARAVLNLAHGDEALGAVTHAQGERLVAALRPRLRGDERLALDFGCGTGRFTALLASAIGGRAVGVDPVAELLARAPAHPRVELRQMLGGAIPLADATADVVLVCLVLGGITDEAELARTAAELARVLRDDGLLLLVENTEPRADLPHWRYRPAARYAALFPDVALEPAGSYLDAGERIELLAGRRRSREAAR